MRDPQASCEVAALRARQERRGQREEDAFLLLEVVARGVAERVEPAARDSAKRLGIACQDGELRRKGGVVVAEDGGGSVLASEEPLAHGIEHEILAPLVESQ